jgi:hypothetical protein
MAADGGALTLGSLVAYLQYVDRFFLPIHDLAEKYNILQSAMASSDCMSSSTRNRLCNFSRSEYVLRNSPGKNPERGELLSMSERATVIGVFEDPRMAQQAIQELKRTGFSEDQVGFVMRKRDTAEADSRASEVEGIADSVTRGIIGGVIGAADLLLLPVIGPSPAANALETALPAAEEVIDTIRGIPHPADAINRVPTDSDHEAKEGAANNKARVETAAETAEITPDTKVKEEVGVVSGGVVGGVLGAASALLIPGIGLVIAGGMLIAALSGAAMGAVAGGFLNALEDMGVSEKKADHYKHEIEVGRTIVTVDAINRVPTREQEVVDLLRRNGAHDVQTHARTRRD